jgi:hypothetical protein
MSNKKEPVGGKNKLPPILLFADTAATIGFRVVAPIVVFLALLLIGFLHDSPEGPQGDLAKAFAGACGLIAVCVLIFALTFVRQERIASIWYRGGLKSKLLAAALRLPVYILFATSLSLFLFLQGVESWRLESGSAKEKKQGQNPNELLNASGASNELKSGKNFGGEFTGQKALTTIFGNFDPSIRKTCDSCEAGGSIWSPRNTCSEESLQTTGLMSDRTVIRSFLSNLEKFGENAKARAYAIKPFLAGGRQNIYLVIETEIDTCNACSALLGVSLWSRHGERWHLDNLNPAIRPMGGAGSLASATELIKVGPDRYGLFLARQHNDRVEAVVVLEDAIGNLRVAFNEKIADGNSSGPYSCKYNDVPCWGYSSDITFDSYSKGPYYELVRTTQGTKKVWKENMSTIEPYEEVQRYTFTGRLYAKQGNAQQLN